MLRVNRAVPAMWTASSGEHEGPDEVKEGMKVTYINDIRRQPLILNITLSSTCQLTTLYPFGPESSPVWQW